MRLLLAALVSVSLLTARAVAISVFADTVSDDATSSGADVSPSPDELALFTLTNEDRLRAGLPPVVFDYELLGVARARGAAQTTEPTLTHLDASGRVAYLEMIKEVDASFVRAGENLASVPAPPANAAERAEQALMESPMHRANILQPDFNRLAIGHVTDGSGRVVFAEIFRAVPAN